VGLSAGITLPSGDFNTIGHLGWNLGALVEIRSRVPRLRTRFDSLWLHMTGIFAHEPGGPQDNLTRFRIIGTTANASYTLGSLLPPGDLYVIAGAGVYIGHSESEDFPRATSATRLGVDVGAGWRIENHGPTTIVEVRYHYLFQGAKLLQDASTSGSRPLTVFLVTAGVLF
jgi:hypothetical protein